MTHGHDGWTTASIEAIPAIEATKDPTPGLVLVYSRLHKQLPSAVPFASEVTTFGRESDNVLCIPEAAVSRYHGRVERRQDGCWIVDNGSTNGVLVNGVRIGSQKLSDHDVVRIGDTLFRFAAKGIYGYGAYRIDGSVVQSARPIHHGLEDCPLIGGYQIDQLLERVAKVAKTQLSVIVTGESGTGKELVARTVHEASGRPGPFQAINCAALPANLIESELFGYRKGAFTGASQDKPGLVRAAHRGTLFLDEIGDMPSEAQAKLLRVLQERQVLPVGATQPEPVDVRVVCATHRHLEELVSSGTFRGDLFARLREFIAPLPPLRERREDLHPLVRHFLEKAGRSDASLTLPYMVGLAHYRWPYNVRELESAVKLSVALAEGRQELDLAHLPEPIRQCLQGHGEKKIDTNPQPAVSEPPPARSGPPSEAALRELLSRHRGNIAAVGRELGKERMQIHRWLKRYDIDVNEYRA
ncbi:MAG TPA: sigma 54-interacting transcriptional regulator [Sandaracinaceae bacterium LLY-WYZ-13_1]|nr:sigma 54-interacting transcriptional regulator [Sandaracinaceae bacterium LLY-WYZ-13_1]